MPVRIVNGRQQEEQSTRNLAARRRRHGNVGAKSGQGFRNTAGATGEAVDAVEEMEALLADKQYQLGAVVDRHDTLVREKFHMEQFTMMLQYDPEEAKHDDSQVFRDYKAQYDLVDKAIPAPSRPTRGSRTQQIQLLKTSSISAPIPASFAQSKHKSKAKTSSAVREQAGSPSKSQQETVVVRSQGNGLLSASDNSPELDTHQESISVILSRKRGEKLTEPATNLPMVKKRRLNGGPTSAISEQVEPIPGRRSGRLRTSITSPAHPPVETEMTVEHTLPVSTSAISKRLTTGELEAPCISAPPDTPKFNIKRVRLLVRRPPPNLTNPQQRPPTPKYKSSLKAFLNSYTTFDGADVDETFLQQKSAADAVLLERVEALREQGRFIPDPEMLLDLKFDDQSLQPLHWRTNKDQWDNVIDSTIQLRQSWVKRTPGQQIAGQIAAKIQTYWEGQVAKKEKLRQQEERNLRALAKATIRMVTNEWKKAVFHVREQERLRFEAEEVRRGHEHLDALLNQSGRLLETQQIDLSRSEIPRSRSSSISNTFRGWEDEEDEGEESADADADEEGEREGEEDMDAQLDVAKKGGDEETSVAFGGNFRPDGDLPSEEDDGENDTRMLLGQNLTQDATMDDNLSDYKVEPVTLVQDGHIEKKLLQSPEPSIPSSPRPLVARNAEGERGTPPPPPTVQATSSPTDSPGPQTPSSQADGLSLLFPQESPSLSLNTADRDFDYLPHSLQSPSSSAPVDVHDSTHRSSQIVEDFSLQLNGLCATADDDLHFPLAQVTSPETEEGELQAQTTEAVDDDRAQEQGPELPTAPETEADVDDASHASIPSYLKPYAVAPVDWDPNAKVVPPLLLRGVLRPYQQSGLEWLASLHINNLNGILADEMGLGKTIQTIALLAHLACDRGIWGPHLIIVPTSVLLNWEMEFKKFLPGFKVLSYHGNTKRRKELRQGWNDKHHFNVCITSYTLASRDAHIFKRKAWYYMVLDEAHMIKNFKSQRWNILLMFRSFRRLLLTGTPLQNNLTELWALLQFLMSGAHFANLKEFGDWFSNPLEKAIEMGNVLDDETLQRVSKLHTVLRPYLLRRLKRDVEKELPSKFEHLLLCPLSKRQRFLYDEFMARAQTRDALQSGVYQKIANILMQLRKVCNHPDLFEVRPILTSFAMEKSAIADFEIKELLVRRKMMQDQEETINLGILGLQFINAQNTSTVAALESRRLDATAVLPCITEIPGEPPPKDMRTITGFHKYSAYMQRARTIAHWSHIRYLNRLRCDSVPIYSLELLNLTTRLYQPILPLRILERHRPNWEEARQVNTMVRSYEERADDMASLIDRFAFVTPPVVALDMPRIALPGCESALMSQTVDFDQVLHTASVKLQIAFPDPSLLQYDCGKLQELTRLLREKKAGGHRILIFTQMTRILDILEIFLNLHGYLYLRLDGATKIEDRQYITERFNADARIFCFIASSRSGGVGINLTGADTVIFYDSDFNPQMDKQCEDRAHRIGQIRDVHIYRFVSQYTVEEALLRKANQKRSLDDLVIQKGEFDWRSLFNDQSALSKALEEFEDTEDAHAAAVAAREEVVMEGADEEDFDGDVGENAGQVVDQEVAKPVAAADADAGEEVPAVEVESDSEEGGTMVDYMILFVQRDYDYFREWRI